MLQQQQCPHNHETEPWDQDTREGAIDVAKQLKIMRMISPIHETTTDN
jgi:hypothetical protein